MVCKDRRHHAQHARQVAMWQALANPSILAPSEAASFGLLCWLTWVATYMLASGRVLRDWLGAVGG